MSWLAFVPDLLIATALALVPGLLIGGALGLRRAWLVAAAPAITVAGFAFWATLLGLAGVPWSLTSAGVSTLATAALAWLAGRRLPRTAGTGGPAWPVILGAVLAAPFVLWGMKLGMSRPDIPPQTWDAMFHLVALREILQTGDGSMLTLGRVAAPAATWAFYPAGWHDLAVLGYRGNLIATANAASMVVAAVVYPLGLGGLGSVLSRSPLAPVATALAGSAMIAFPARMLSYGTLWPNALGYALIPAALALVIGFAESRRAAGAYDWRLGLGAVGAIGGVAAAHPNAFFALVLLAAPYAVARWIPVARRAWREPSLPLRALTALTVVTAAGLGVAALVLAPGSYDREPYGTLTGALLGALTDSQLAEQGYGNANPSWLLAAGLLLGCVAVFVAREHRWLVASLGLAVWFFALAVVTTLPGYGLTSPWYSDPVRLGAMVPLVAAPLIGIGAAWLVALARPRWRPALGAAVVVALVAGTGALRAVERDDQLHKNYEMIPEDGLQALVSLKELELLARLDEDIPEGAVILGSPFDGTPFAFVLSGVEVVYPHMKGNWDEKSRVLARIFNEAQSNPQVCDLLADLGVEYFYDDRITYGPDFGGHSAYDGFEIDHQFRREFLTLVDSGGGASLYRITGCD